MTAPTILFLGSVPDGQRGLRLDREVRAIADAVGASLRLVTVWAASFEDLLAGLLAHRPAVVHFSGHGRPDALLFEEADGRAAPASLGALAGLFAAARVPVEVVVFNACYSAAAAQAVVPHVGCAVGAAEPIGDAAAVKLAGALYRALAAGRSAAEAVALGRVAVEGAGFEGAEEVKLLHRSGVDPAAVRVVRPASPLAGRLTPGTQALPRYATPAQYLVARFEGVAFAGREALLAELDRWADDAAPVAVRLVHGPGGAGKTRLAQAWLKRRRADAAGFFDGPLDAEAVAALAETPRADVVIDGASTRPGLSGLLAALARRLAEGGAGRLRVLLLARGDGAWWASLAQDAAIGGLLADSPPPLRLPPLVEPADRAAEFERAAACFQALRGWAGLPPTPDLADARFEQVLYLHMAAFLAGEGAAVPAEAVLGAFLDQEVAGLPRGAVAVLAAAALRGGLADVDALAQVATAFGEESSEIEGLLTPRARTAAHLVAPLAPDLLAEALVLRVWADGQLFPGWLDRAMAGADLAAWTAAFTLLGRAEGLDAGAAAAAERALLALGRTEALEPALQALLALATWTSDARLGPALAEALAAHGTAAEAAAFEPRLPMETVNLAEVGLWVQQARLAGASTPIERARCLNNVAIRLARVGRVDEGRAAAAEAVDILRAHPELPAGLLATALDTLATQLSAVGAREEAVAAGREAVEHARRGGEPADVARTLDNVSVLERAVGDWEAALAASTEALALHRQAGDPVALARSLTNAGLWLGGLGRGAEGLPLLAEAVALRRPLAAARPDAFEPALAAALSNLALRQGELGEPEAAVAATEEAAAIHRRLAGARPEVWRATLAGTLNNLGVLRSGLGLRAEALAAMEEALAVRRALAAARPEVHEAGLAAALSNVALLRAAVGAVDEALIAGAEAVARYRALAAARPAAFDGELGVALDGLGTWQAGVGRLEDALASAQEAVAVYRRLVAERPAAFQQDLARSLMNLALRLYSLQRRGEALAASTEAVALQRALAAHQPAAFEPALARGLMTLGIGHAHVGDRAAALAATDEAVGLLRGLAAAQPAAFTPDLAGALTNRGQCLADLGQAVDALAATEEAVALYRALQAAEPAAFAGALAQGLVQLAARRLAAGLDAQAVAAEAVAAWRPLAQTHPDACAPKLADALITAATAAAGDAALAAADEAIALLAPRCAARPGLFDHDLARARGARGVALAGLDRGPEALQAFREALALLGPSLARQPAAFTPLARALLRDARAVAGAATPPDLAAWAERLGESR
ncbi:MAG: tetratricopeptide repeat protein [Myxococcales bacterium]|nr:tetratricopeptide repeat protein [Myxococcales bacterium]